VRCLGLVVNCIGIWRYWTRQIMWCVSHTLVYRVGEKVHYGKFDFTRLCSYTNYVKWADYISSSCKYTVMY